MGTFPTTKNKKMIYDDDIYDDDVEPEEQRKQLELLLKLLPVWDELIDTKYCDERLTLFGDLFTYHLQLGGSKPTREQQKMLVRVIDSYRLNSHSRNLYGRAEKFALREAIRRRVEKLFPDIAEIAEHPLNILLSKYELEKYLKLGENSKDNAKQNHQRRIADE